MSRIRTRRVMAVAAISAALASAGAVAAPTPAQAAFTGPPVQLIPQHVSQNAPFHGQQVLTADGNSVGDKARLSFNVGLPSQKWHYRFNGGSVAQIVNDASGLCLKGAGVDGNTVRLATCVDPNRIFLSISERRQFWDDRQRLFNGVIVHRLENSENGKPMGIRTSGTSVGILETQPFTGAPNQLFRNQPA